MRLATKVAYNTIVQVASKVLATILGLVAVAMMTRYLGQTGFGEYTTIVTFLSFFGIFADLGLTLVTVQMISRPGADEKKILNNLFSLRFFSALAVIGLAPVVGFFFPYSPLVKAGVAIASLSFFLVALNQIMVGLFQKYLRLDRVAIAETASRVVLVAGTFLAVRFDAGLLGLLWAIIAGSFVSFILHFIFSLRFIRWRLELDLSLWREIITRSWPLAVTIIFNLLYLKTDTLILSLVKSQAEVGLYGASYKVIEILTMIPFMFAGVVLPILTNDWAGGGREHFQRVLQKSFDLMAIIALPLVVGTQFLARGVMTVVAGPDFAAAGVILQILVCAAGPLFMSCLLSHAVVAVGRQRELIGAYFFTAVTSVGGYLLLIPSFSYFGAAAVTVYSETAIMAFMFYYAYKCAAFRPSFKIFWRAFGAAAVMAASLFVIPLSFYDRAAGLLIVLFLAAAVYFSALYFFRGLTKDDLRDLLNKNID